MKTNQNKTKYVQHTKQNAMQHFGRPVSGFCCHLIAQRRTALAESRPAAVGVTPRNLAGRLRGPRATGRPGPLRRQWVLVCRLPGGPCHGRQHLATGLSQPCRSAAARTNSQHTATRHWSLHLPTLCGNRNLNRHSIHGFLRNKSPGPPTKHEVDDDNVHLAVVARPQ